MTVTCPRCQNLIKVDDSRAGFAVQCGDCETFVMAPRSETTALPPLAPATPVDRDAAFRAPALVTGADRLAAAILGED